MLDVFRLGLLINQIFVDLFLALLCLSNDSLFELEILIFPLVVNVVVTQVINEYRTETYIN
jgi:hypothetical protein